jgi:glycosyltransferase involved in cell wall biosynthesis
MESTKSVTIGIPTYNRLPYLKEAVESALSQTYWNCEILISQNPHDDLDIRREVAEYCQSLAVREPRVRYAIRQRNVGPPANFQWLVDNARGEFIILIGDDDRLLPNAVESLVNVVTTDVVVSFGRRHIIDSQGRRRPRFLHPANPDAYFFEGWPYSQYQVPAGYLHSPEVWTWRQAMGVETSLIRTRDFRRIRYREDIDMPDLEFFIFLAREGGKFVFVPEYVTEYRFHPDSTTGGGFSNFKELFDDLEGLSVGPEIQPFKQELLEWLAFKAVSKSLMAGNLDIVRRLLRSEYYPMNSATGKRGKIIKMCAALPGKLGPAAYRLLYFMKLGRRYSSMI